MFSTLSVQRRAAVVRMFLRVCTADSKSVMHAEHYHFAASVLEDVPDQSGFCNKYPLIDQFEIPSRPG
jgi:hypothetical protein